MVRHYHAPGQHFRHARGERIAFPSVETPWESRTTQGLGAVLLLPGGMDYIMVMEPLFPELEGNARWRRICAGETWLLYG